MTRLALSFLALSLILLPRAAADDARGAATPQDLMRAVGEALHRGDRAALLSLIDRGAAPADIADLVADSLLAAHGLVVQREAAAAKLGPAAGMYLSAASGGLERTDLDTAALADEGVLTKGRNGTASLACPNPGTGGRRRVALIERDGRWYLDAEAPSSPAQLDAMRTTSTAATAAVAGFNKTVAQLLASDADEAAFQTGVVKAAAALVDAMAKASAPPAAIRDTPIGGPSGDPVGAERLRGARLAYIKGGLVWTFGADRVSIVGDPGLPADLVELLLGKGAAAATRITATWTCDGRSIELTELAAGDTKVAGPVRIAIGTAGNIRVDLGDGRQYNVLDGK